MELVYVHPEGKKYSGIDVSIGGETYNVITEGSRQLLRGVPEITSSGKTPVEMPRHFWIPSGIASADMVEQAAQEAFRAQSKARLAQEAAEKAAAEAKDAAARVENEKAKREAANKKDADSKKDADKK